MIDDFARRATLRALMIGTAFTPAIAQDRAATAASANASRTATTLATGWRFYPGDAPADAAAASFDDAAWQSVSVPHTWNRVGFYLPDPKSHINRADNVDKRQGWYRLTFTPDAASAGKRAWLKFDAATRDASVWLNGKKLGDHDGGFSRFRFDATSALLPGVANVLVRGLESGIVHMRDMSGIAP